MARMHHSMIRVLEAERSMAFYDKAFGLKPCHRIDFDDFSLIYLRNDEDDFQLELTVNNGRMEPYDPGNGYGHLALSVADLDAEHKRLTKTAKSWRGFSSSKIRTVTKSRCWNDSAILPEQDSQD
jgi:lactoylglutathione lyase